MHIVKKVSDKMNDSQREVLGRVLVDLQDGASPERISKLDEFFVQLQREIDQVNRRRDATGAKIRNLTDLITAVEDQVSGGKVSAEEVEFFLMFLISSRSFLRRDVAEMRPELKLQKKYDVEQKLESLRLMQRAVEGMETALARE